MKSKNNSAFTLVEVMISVVILGVGLALVINSYITASRGLNSVSNNIEAWDLARKKLSELQILSLKGGLIASRTNETLKSSTGKDLNVDQNITEIVKPEDLGKKFVKACLSINWREQNATKNVALSTYLAAKQKPETE